MKKILSLVLVMSLLFSMFTFSVSVIATEDATQYTQVGFLGFEDENKVGEGNFVEYGINSNTELASGDYKKGASTAPIALVTDEVVNSGKYALKYYNRSEKNHRIKLANVIPNDISSYIGTTMKVSGYLYFIATSPNTTVGDAKISIMNDQSSTPFVTSNFSIEPEKWTYFEISIELDESHIVTSGDITYPLRIAVEQSKTPTAEAMYMDDFKCEIADKSALLYAEQGFETDNTEGTHFNASGSPAPTITLNSDTTYVKTGNYSAKAVTTGSNSGLRVKNVMDKIVCNDNVGKTFKITTYIMPVYEQGELAEEEYAENIKKLAFRLSIARTSDGKVNGSAYKFGIKNNEWNKVTMLYNITEDDVENDYDSLRIDQEINSASWNMSTVLVPTFYVDDIVVEEYADFYTPSMTVYKNEGFENTDQTFTQYSTGSYSDLTNSDNEYKMGGNYYNSLLSVGTVNWQSHSGSKSLILNNISNNANNKFSARIKLNNMLPNDMTQYNGFKFKLSMYIRAEGNTGGQPATIGLGIMTDYNTTPIASNTAVCADDEWTYLSYEFEMTKDLLDDERLGLIDDTNRWPLRPFISLGTIDNHPTNLYIDDFKVEYENVNANIGVTIPRIFANNMVLQRNKKVPVWGWDGTPGETITAKIDTVSASATVDSNGKFYLELPAMSGAKNKVLTILNSTTGASVDYKNVGIGEVWYCSGQSNMELKMSKIYGVDDIIAKADDLDMRSFKVSVTAKYELQNDVSSTSSWSVITSDNVSNISAIGYIAGSQIQEELDVPVALIECYQGGSAGQAWLSYDKVFAPDRENIYNNSLWKPTNANGSHNKWGCEGRTMWEDYDYYWSIGEIYETEKEKGTLIDGTSGSEGRRFAPTGFYNAMQGPLANYAIAGVMWYQGESQPNSRLWEQYNYVLCDLINQWREDFKDANLPVMIVQLAPYASEEGREFTEIRQVQLDTHKRMNNVEVIATAYEGTYDDVHDPDGTIHPGTKRPVGDRMANTILATVYNKDIEYCGPEYDYMEVNDNKAILYFTHISDGLKIKDGETELTGFTISADGQNFVDATAKIVNDTVEVYADSIAKPVAVRYAFLNNFEVSDGPNTLSGNLENSINQPAFPFKASLTDPYINNIKFTDLSSNELKTVTGADIKNGIKFDAEIYELAHNKTAHKVIVALYNGENMVSAKVYSTQFNTAGNYIVSGDIKDDTTFDNGKIKVFLWDGFDKIQPLSASKITNITQ